MVCIIIFVSVEEFERLIEKGHFLEYAKVFGGNYYGTSLPAIEENLAKGIDVAVEATGLFLTDETARKHITAGAKKSRINRSF